MNQVDRKNIVVEPPPGCPEDPVEMWEWIQDHPREVKEFVKRFEAAHRIKTVIRDLTHDQKKNLSSKAKTRTRQIRQRS